MRNRWQRIEKGRKAREAGHEMKNRCHACGMPKRGHVCMAKMRGGPRVEEASGVRANPANPAPIADAAMPPLRRSRSNSKVPDDFADANLFGVPAATSTSHANGGRFSVDVGAAMPMVGRRDTSTTSFFRNLVNADVFSPTSREFINAWVDSPRDAPAPAAALVIADAAAPPQLRRVASGDASEARLTRSVSSYINELAFQQEPDAAPRPAGGSSALGPPSSALGPPPTFVRAPSMLGPSRDPSAIAEPNLGRSITSFVRETIDVSAFDSFGGPTDAMAVAGDLANPADTDLSELIPLRRQSSRSGRGG